MQTSNFWFKYHAGDIEEADIQCLIAEKGYEAYYIYMKLVDISIKSNGLITLDKNKIAIILHMQAPKRFDRLLDIMSYLTANEMITYENNTYVVPLVRSRIGSEEDILLNQSGTTLEEINESLIDEMYIELAAANFTDEESISRQAASILLKRYPARDILKATREFARAFAIPTLEERIIEDKAKYLMKSLLEIIRGTPAKSQEELCENMFFRIIFDSDYITPDDQEEVGHLEVIYKDLKEKYEERDILTATNKFIESVSLNNKTIENKGGYLRSTLIKILKGMTK